MAKRDEQGATLVLALVFLVVAGGIITALLGWSGSDINNVANFQLNRTFDYAANSAVQVEIQNVRYSSSNCPNGYTSVPIPNQQAAASVTMDVWCSTVTNYQSAATRVVTLTTCSDASRIKGTCSQAHPFLTVKVTFDDYASSGQIATQTCTTTCGTTMTIDSWTFR